ncbi:hypothetical protein [Zavarzinella formosa]|uniref:hypothetical protein n=1 Tax=Zavarzinella formosa TaxID=360055 RepID=UPI00031F8C41|nr:hypothetical protein [Zavarzinella formosa]
MTTLLCLAAIIGTSPASLLETRRTGNLEIRATADIDTAEIRLSGEVRLRLIVEGPTPLEVTRPKPLLTTTGTWRVREEGLPLREILPNQRQRWVMEYRLSPLVPGEATPISLSPLIVQSGPPDDIQIAWKESLHIKVTTTIKKPNAEDLRPVTGIEQTPDDPTPPALFDRRWWLFAAGLLALLIVGIDQYRRRSRDVIEILDAAWAERQMAGTADPDRLVIILRQFLEHRLNQPFAARTSAELADELRGIPECPVVEVEAFLEMCDTARFSGTTGDSMALREQLRAIILALTPVE